MQTAFTTIRLEYLKWLQSLKIALSKSLNYKINFLILMVVPVLVFFVIKYNLWHSIYAVHSYKEIQGYSLDMMIEYQFWILIFDFFVRSHFFGGNIAREIRMGKISTFLLYPFSFISYQLSLFVSDKLIQIFIGAFSLLLALGFGWVDLPSVKALFQTGVFVFMVSAFWFFTQMIVGFVSFWLEETWSLNVSIRFISAFFAGSIIPLDLYPEMMTRILMWTPFPYLTYVPVRILMGEAVDVGSSFLVLLVWLVVLFFCVQWIWKKGLKLYTGTGI